MSATKTKLVKVRRRITNTDVVFDNKSFVLTFTVDGVRCKEKFQRGELITKFPELVGLILGKTVPVSEKQKCGKPNAKLKNAKAIELDVAAEDIKILADLFENDDVDKRALEDAKKQLLAAIGIVRAKLTLI